MLRRKAFKFKLRPNGYQVRRMRAYAGSCRYIYNRALALQIDRLEDGDGILRYVDLARMLTEWRHDSETSWLSESPCHPLQQSLKDLDRAFTNLFKKRSRFPRFKRKGRRESFRYPDPKQFRVDQDNSRVFLPKLGWMRYRNSRRMEGEFKNITVYERCGDWYISIQVEMESPVPEHKGGVVGLDMGVVRFVTLSDGTHYEPMNSFRQHEDRLRIAQQSLSRKVKGSNNWKKQNLRVGKIHARIADVRSDYLHKVSHIISKNHAVVCMEDLKVKNMSRSSRGTRQNPGRNVRVKSGLNKAILDQGWGEFRRQLEYKTLWRGGSFVAVPAHHTSQTCPVCYSTSPDNRTSRSTFECISCGFQEHADLVGAMNVRRAGLARIACEVNDAVMSSATGTHRNVLTLRNAA